MFIPIPNLKALCENAFLPNGQGDEPFSISALIFMDFWKNKSIESLEDEIWLPINNYPLFEISNLCRVKRLAHTKEVDVVVSYTLRRNGKVVTVCSHSNIKNRKAMIASQSISRIGYLKVVIYNDDKTFTTNSHRLIAQGFIPNPDNKPCVNHLNGIKHDNRIENLEWCTYKENTQHSLNILGHSMTGQNHPRSILTDNDVREVKYLHNNGSSQGKLALKFGVSPSTIWLIIHGKKWKHLLPSYANQEIIL